MAKFKPLDITDLLLIEPETFYDERGFFYESYNQKEFDMAVNRKVNFVQDNHSKSYKGILRGLHYQVAPFQQGKLVRVVHGEVWDVAVDIRKDSVSYGHWVAEKLSAENKKQLWIPEGFAHGFVVTSEEAEFCYKTTNFYDPQSERCIIFNDISLNIKWPINEKNLMVNEKDLKGMSFDEIINNQC